MGAALGSLGQIPAVLDDFACPLGTQVAQGLWRGWHSAQLVLANQCQGQSKQRWPDVGVGAGRRMSGLLVGILGLVLATSEQSADRLYTQRTCSTLV